MTDYKENLFHNSPPAAFSKSRSLRRNSTDAEKVLWQHLRNNKMMGHKFRRQHPLGKYIADFYCHELHLIIEVDGNIHLDKDNKKYDADRDFSMSLSGIKTIRFKNKDVIEKMDDVLKKIRDVIKEIETSPPAVGI